MGEPSRVSDRVTAAERRPMVARGEARLCERNPWKRATNHNIVGWSPEGATEP